MRSFGSRPGNPALRTAIELAGRRRRHAAPTPEREPGDPADGDPLALRWTRAFFDHLRASLLPRMSIVETLDVGELRHVRADGLGLWALAAPCALVIAREQDETPDRLRERARRWRACLATRTAPGLASPHWGHPLYGARLEPETGGLEVVWALPGEWLRVALGDAHVPGAAAGFAAARPAG